jgi:predicted nucleic acid-binding protein
MIVLDTNVISDFFGRRPNERVNEWLNSQEVASLFLTTVVLAELYYGAFLVTEPLRHEELLQSIGRVKHDFHGRVLSFGDAASEIYGRITANRRRIGRPTETKDAMIAAICIVHGATLATRNVRDFDGLDLKLVNPFEAA